MEKVLLSTIVKQVRGVSYSKDDDLSPSAADGFTALLRANNIERGTITNVNDLVYVSEQKVKKEQYLIPGDILIAASSGSIDVVGKSALYEGEGKYTFGAFCKVVRPNKEKVNPKYVGYFFQTAFYRKRISALAQGANINNLRNEHIDDLEIPLPDHETQNKIVAILDKAKALLDKREKTIAMYDELLRATFLDMFGDPCNPRRDDLERLKEVLTDIDAGWSPVCEEMPRNSPNQNAILKQSAITKRYFDPEQNKLLPNGLAIKKAVYAKKSDLLFSRKNTPELVGSTAYVFDDYENLLLPDTIFSLRYDDSKVSGTYLYFLFNDKEFRKKIQDLSVGQAKSMSNISQERLLQLEIPRPNLEKQNEFENIVLTTYHSFYKKCLESRSTSELLVKSLSQQAFGDRVNIDVDVQLEALIDVIDPDKKDEENSVATIKKDLTLLQRLIDKLKERDFKDDKQYGKAVYMTFRIMKEEPNLIKQELDAIEKEVTLKL